MADLSQTAGSVAFSSGSKTTGTAGETITAGMPLYIDSSDSRLYKADANVAAKRVVVGIALNGASAGQPLTYQTSGVINLGATLAIGQTYVLSAAVGAIAVESDIMSGEYLVLIGVATTAALCCLTINSASIIAHA